MSLEKIVMSSAGLEASVDNYDEFDLDINPDNLGEQLVQKNNLKGTIKEYRLYASRYLLLSFRKTSKRSQQISYPASLACLDPEPEHNRTLVWKWLLTALLIGILACLSFYLADSQADHSIYYIVAGSMTLTASIICLLIFIYLMRDEYIFRGRYGKVRLFLIENNKPDKETFEVFFSNLQQQIHNAQKNIPVSDSLVSELKMCRYLRDHQIINEETYNTARTAIFRHEQYKA